MEAYASILLLQFFRPIWKDPESYDEPELLYKFYGVSSEITNYSYDELIKYYGWAKIDTLSKNLVKRQLDTNSEDISKDILKTTSAIVFALRANKKKLEATLRSRFSMIANSFVQSGGEYGKFLHMIEFARSNNAKISKTWISRLDNRVRLWHRAATFQKKDLFSPFISGGERLQYPGDWSLGASPANVINCRCVAHYRLG